MFSQSIKMAWEAIGSNKMRSFLTMLGIIIGVVALVVLVSLVNGATDIVTDEITSLGTDMLSVTVTDDKGNPLRLIDMEALTDGEEIGQAAPATSMQASARRSNSETIASVTGTVPAYADIQNLALADGRFLRTADVYNASYVAVLGRDTAKDLFNSTEVVGQTILVNGTRFLVVGVLDEDDSLLAGIRGGTPVYVPVTTLARLSGNADITSFVVSATGDADAAQKFLDTQLLMRFANDADAYTLHNMSTISDTMSSVTDTLTLLLGGIAAISLLVGGIGIMNIMLVSVTERTKEIGIRKAIGANRRSILLQFLIEALLISLIGAGIGLALSWILLQIISVVSAMTFPMSAGVVALAAGFSTAIGLIFGLYPANKAATRHPIEALRYEG